jgi:hypothetical protein
VARGDLHVAGALQRPQHEKRFRNARAPSEEAVVPEDHRRLAVEVAHQALLLSRFHRDAFEIVIRHPPVQHRGVEVVRRQTFLQARDRYAARGVRVHHAVRVRHRFMDRRMDDEAGAVDRPIARPHGVAVDVDENQVGSLDLAVVQAEGVDEEPDLGPRHPHRDVVEDHLDPAEHVEDAIAGRELHPRLPFGVGHGKRLRRSRRILEIDGHRSAGG